MPNIEINIKLTSDEFRAVLPDPIQKLFDSLVENLTSHTALSMDESKAYVAQMLLDYFKFKEAKK